MSKKEEEELEETTKIKGSRKRKWTSIDEISPSLTMEIVPYKISPGLKGLIKTDVINKRNWDAALESVKLGYPVRNRY
jgi:hypothetical protein